MSAVLYIKDAATSAQARELAELTGETLTEAVAASVRLRLEQIRRERLIEERMARARQIGEQVRAIMDREGIVMTSTDHGELFYDEFGAPK